MMLCIEPHETTAQGIVSRSSVSASRPTTHQRGLERFLAVTLSSSSLSTIRPRASRFGSVVDGPASSATDDLRKGSTKSPSGPHFTGLSTLMPGTLTGAQTQRRRGRFLDEPRHLLRVATVAADGMPRNVPILFILHAQCSDRARADRRHRLWHRSARGRARRRAHRTRLTRGGHRTNRREGRPQR